MWPSSPPWIRAGQEAKAGRQEVGGGGGHRKTRLLLSGCPRPGSCSRSCRTASSDLSGEKGVDIDCHMVELDDVRYHIQLSTRKPNVMVLSVAFSLPSPEIAPFCMIGFRLVQVRP